MSRATIVASYWFSDHVERTAAGLPGQDRWRFTLTRRALNTRPEIGRNYRACSCTLRETQICRPPTDGPGGVLLHECRPAPKTAMKPQYNRLHRLPRAPTPDERRRFRKWTGRSLAPGWLWTASRVEQGRRDQAAILDVVRRRSIREARKRAPALRARLAALTSRWRCGLAGSRRLLDEAGADIDAARGARA